MKKKPLTIWLVRVVVVDEKLKVNLDAFFKLESAKEFVGRLANDQLPLGWVSESVGQTGENHSCRTWREEDRGKGKERVLRRYIIEPMVVRE